MKLQFTDNSAIHYLQTDDIKGKQPKYAYMLQKLKKIGLLYFEKHCNVL